MIADVLNVFRTLVPDLLRYRWLILASLGSSGLVIAADAVQPLLYKTLIDGAILHADYHLALLVLVFLVLLGFLRALLSALNSHIGAWVGSRISAKYRQALFDHALYLPMSVLDNLESGTLVYRITRDCGRFGDLYLTDQLIPALSQAARALVLAAILVILDWRVGLLALMVFPLFFVVTQKLAGKSRQLDERYRALHQRGQNFLQEVLAGIRQVRTFGQERHESERWGEWLQEHWQITGQTVVLHDWVRQGLFQFINNVGLGLVYGYGAWLVISHDLTIGSLVALASYATQFYSSCQTLLSFRLQTTEAHNSLRAVQEILAHPREWPDRGQPLARPVRGNVEFRDVSFTYPDSSSGISHVSLRVEPGEFIGIVGPSGGGKSTIIDLCMRFYTPESGQVLLDGADIAELAGHNLRNHVGLVSQDVLLWNATIKENILYGLDGCVAWNDVLTLCKTTRVHEFVSHLPAGYDTIVGERGVKLSGGEKQRIALTRVVLRNPKVLLLDEATAAQDALTEAAIMEAVLATALNKTIIAVAHRLSTVQSADRIVVIEHGRIVELGRPAALYDQQGLYTRLYDAQRLHW